MRQPVQRQAIEALMQGIGKAAQGPGAVYLVGGACSVLMGWRETTVDIDLALAPEPPGLFGSLAALKESLGLNIELASPGQFVPPLPGWQGRSPYLLRVGLVDFYHYDFYSQAFAKLSRDHDRDKIDVAAMVKYAKIEPQRLMAYVTEVMPEMARYPHLDSKVLVDRIRAWAKSTSTGE
jgi:hypothetical protein